MLFLILTVCFLGVTHAICPMRPTVNQSSANRTLGDGDYKILFRGLSNEYIPDKIYRITVQGSAISDGLKPFKGYKLNMHSQDFPTDLDAPGDLFPSFTTFSGDLSLTQNCFDVIPDSESDIQVKWQAPKAGSGCVVFTAMVLENNERWYAEDGALTKTVCEARTELVSMNDTSKLEVAENIEDKSARSLHVKLIQKQHIVYPDDRIHLAKTIAVCMTKRISGRCNKPWFWRYYRRWTFNPQRLKCKPVPFWYGRCQGNQNNFLSEETCDKACDIVRTALIRQVHNVTVNRDQTPTDSLSPSPSSPPPVDCVVTRWSNWSPCSVTCGVGRVTRYRTIEREAANGGRRCPKKLHRHYRCKLAPCE